MRTPTSFATSILLITSIILTGGVITIGVSLTDTLAFSDKIVEQKQIQQQQQQKDDDNDKNYQNLYKQYDFEKYLNYHYTYNTEYKENPDSNSDADISEKNPFAGAAIHNNVNDKDDNKKQEQQQQQSNRDNKDETKAEYILELDGKEHFVDDKKYSTDNINKKTYKNIKIIECRNFNINAYEIEDLKSIETLLNKPTTIENENSGNQQGKSQENTSNEAKVYDINSNTKVIFICNNENHDLRPINSNNLTKPLTNDGIILPIHSQNNNYNNNINGGEDKTASTISYAQYKKSIANEQQRN